MIRLLFIEDEPEVVEPVIHRLNEKGGYTCKVKDFSEAAATINSFAPHMVILDLLAGGSSSEPEVAGLIPYDLIWDTLFCPIIVYTARPDELTGSRGEHPFVKVVKKSHSIAEIEKAIDDLNSHVEALSNAENDFRRSFAFAMREAAPHAFHVFSDDPARRKDSILRSGRRRLAALMDELSNDGQPLASWEQYLSPPISDDLRLGDVLLEAGESHTDPTRFRVVLTPSCDLVASDVRAPKASEILVARCCSMREGLDLTSLKDTGPRKLPGKLGTILSQGHFEGIIPLPELKDRIPSMAANVKNLELILFEDVGSVGSEGKKYNRVASIDSPFRELVSWAYMQIGCRPGLPDRDFKTWGDEIIASFDSDKKDEKS